MTDPRDPKFPGDAPSSSQGSSAGSSGPSMPEGFDVSENDVPVVVARKPPAQQPITQQPVTQSPRTEPSTGPSVALAPIAGPAAATEQPSPFAPPALPVAGEQSSFLPSVSLPSATPPLQATAPMPSPQAPTSVAQATTPVSASTAPVLVAPVPVAPVPVAPVPAASIPALTTSEPSAAPGHSPRIAGRVNPKESPREVDEWERPTPSEQDKEDGTTTKPTAKPAAEGEEPRGRSFELLQQQNRKRGLALLAGSLVLLLGLGVLTRKQSIESNLKTRIEAAMQGRYPGVTVKVVGRDVELTGNVATGEQFLALNKVVAARPGVRAVRSKVQIVGADGVPQTIPPTTSAETAAASSAGNAGTTTLPTLPPKPRPTYVEAGVEGSVLRIKSTVSSKETRDLLVARAARSVASDAFVDEVTVAVNDGVSDETAHRRVGALIEYLVKSQFNDVKLIYKDGSLDLTARVETELIANQLRAEATQLVGDPAKLTANISVGNAPAASPVLTTTTAATVPLTPEQQAQQEQLDALVSGKTIEFADASARLADNGAAIVDEVGKVILAGDASVRIQISGHTDSRGRDLDNQTLSDERAKAVKERLVAAGIAPERIVTQGFGETKPIASNDSADGRAKNRRIEFTLVGGTAPAGGQVAPAT